MYSISYECTVSQFQRAVAGNLKKSSHRPMLWNGVGLSSKDLIILTAYCWTDCCAGMKLDHKLGQWLFGWHNTSRIWDLGFLPGNTLNPRINFSFRKNFSSRDFCTKYFEVDVSGIISTTRPALILPLSVPDSCCTVGYSRLIRLFLPHKFIIL